MRELPVNECSVCITLSEALQASNSTLLPRSRPNPELSLSNRQRLRDVQVLETPRWVPKNSLVCGPAARRATHRYRRLDTPARFVQKILDSAVASGNPN